MDLDLDEKGGKYTEAQPRCTCPSSESTLQWSLVDTEYNFRALLMRRRQVQRGAAELYLSSIRTESTMLRSPWWTTECNFSVDVDDEGGKYTKATDTQSQGDPKIVKRGPKGDPVLSKKGTKRGPF